MCNGEVKVNCQFGLSFHGKLLTVQKGIDGIRPPFRGGALPGPLSSPGFFFFLPLRIWHREKEKTLKRFGRAAV